MSGEELDKKLKDAGYVLADIARMLGVPGPWKGSFAIQEWCHAVTASLG